MIPYSDLCSLYKRRDSLESGWDDDLPDSIEELSEPIQHLLAKIYRYSERPLPPWRSLSSSFLVKLEWERTELCRNPDLSTQSLTALAEELDWKSPCTPVGLLWRLTRSSKRAIQEEAIKGWDTCLAAGKVGLRESRDALLSLLKSPHEDIVFQAVLEFNKPHYYVAPPPLESLKALLNRSGRIALQALKATRKDGPRAIWLDILEASRDSSLKLEALNLLATVAGEDDLEVILHCAEEDPALYGEAVLEALLQMRRRGLDLSVVSMERVLELLSLGFSADCLVELVSGRWEQWIAILVRLEPDSVLWPTLLDTLKRSGHRSCTDFLRELLISRRVPQCLSQVIEALTELGAREAESLIIQLATDYPVACLAYMEQVGGEASFRFLLEELESPTCFVARPTLIETYLRMGGDAATIDPFCSVADWTWDALKLARTVPLQTLTEIANTRYHSGSIQAVRLLGRREEVKLLSLLLAGEDEGTALEAETALRTVGRKWFSRGRRQPQVLARVGSEAEAEEAFLADRLMIELDKGLHLTITRRLFERLSHLRHPNQRPFLLRWREHEDHEIRKYVLQCQALNQTEPHAQWILARLKSKDIRDVRWALEALSALGESWYGPQVAECLNHPNMNIKKTAAEALQRVGDREVLPQIRHYLSFHDNSGLRDSLAEALRAIVGVHAPALMDESPEPEVAIKIPEAPPTLDDFELRDPQTRDSDLRRLLPAVEKWKPEERFDLIKPIREILSEQQASFLFCLKILKRCEALPTLSEAKLAWSSQDDSLRAWALERLLHGAAFQDWYRFMESCQPEEARGNFVCASRSTARKRLLKFGLRRGWFDNILSLATSSPQSWIRELQLAWEDLYAHAPEPQRLMEAWRNTTGLTRTEIASWLGGGKHCYGQRCRESEQEVLSLLHSSDPGTRQHAAELLLQWGGERNRRAVVDQLLHNRLVARGLSLSLNTSELYRLVEKSGQVGWSDQVKFLIKNSTASPRDQVKALLVFKNSETLGCPEFRHAFEEYDTELVLAALGGDLDAKDWSSLSLIPPRYRVPAQFVERLASTDRETAHIYLRTLKGWGCLLYGPGLLDALLQLMREDCESELALEVLAKLRCWSQPEHGEQLVDILAELRASKGKRKLARELFKRATRFLPPPTKLRLHWKFERSPELVAEAAKAYLEEPDVLSELPTSLQNSVLQECLEIVDDNDPEVAISALEAVLLHQQEKTAPVIRKALIHPSSRVRFWAHRQFKKRLSKEAFFELSLELLHDPQPAMRKRAIKILSHGRYQPAVGKIVDLLWDKKRKVDQAARQGLVRYGKLALPILTKKAARARPDRRREMDAIIQEIVTVSV